MFALQKFEQQNSCSWLLPISLRVGNNILIFNKIWLNANMLPWIIIDVLNDGSFLKFDKDIIAFPSFSNRPWCIFIRFTQSTSQSININVVLIKMYVPINYDRPIDFLTSSNTYTYILIFLYSDRLRLFQIIILDLLVHMFHSC